MILIGMFDSPFVRRVAVSLRLLEVPFEHRNWSVDRDFELIRQFNPLGRVPALVQPDGETLIDSSAILDFLDDSAGPERALLPASGLSAAARCTSSRSRSVPPTRELRCSRRRSFARKRSATSRGSIASAVRCMARWPRSIGSRRCESANGWSPGA